MAVDGGRDEDPATSQPASIPEAYVKAKAALDALVAAIGAEQGQAL